LAVSATDFLESVMLEISSPTMVSMARWRTTLFGSE
jgi:hypothetical protein